jgi:hypothetical protein
MLAKYILQTNMSKTDANLLFKMLRAPGFDLNHLTCKNVESMHLVVDKLCEQVCVHSVHNGSQLVRNPFATPRMSRLRRPQSVHNAFATDVVTISLQPFAPHEFQEWVDQEIASDKKLKRLAGNVRCPTAWFRNTLHTAIKAVEDPNFSGDWDYEQEPM